MILMAFECWILRKHIMNMTKISLIISLALLFAVNVKADGMRCGSYVIEDGDLHKMMPMDEVIRKCGKPSSREGNMLYYEKKGKKLIFDSEKRLVSINDIKNEPKS